MEWIIEVISKNNQFSFDATEIKDLPIEDIMVSKLYYVVGQISKGQLNKSIGLLFKDRIIENHKIYPGERSKINAIPGKRFDLWEVEVFYKNEVTDPDTSYILKALQDIRVPAENVRTGRRYVIRGNLSLDEVKLFSRRYLANLIVQDMFIRSL